MSGIATSGRLRSEYPQPNPAVLCRITCAHCHHSYTGTAAVTAFRVLVNSGTFGGIVRCYGIAKS